MLTAERVREILSDCLFTEDEMKGFGPDKKPKNCVAVEGVVSNFGFHETRLNSYKSEIRELLAELPDNFHEAGGGGWSFLNACMDKHGNHWAEHPSIEALVSLGIGVELVSFLMPRDMWGMLPGSMPYFVVIGERDV